MVGGGHGAADDPGLTTRLNSEGGRDRTQPTPVIATGVAAPDPSSEIAPEPAPPRGWFYYTGRMVSTTTVNPTTVQDLMRILSRYPADLRVVVEGYEDGIDDLEPSDIRQIAIILDKNTDWWNGRHEATSQEESGTAQALLLGRPHRDDYN